MKTVKLSEWMNSITYNKTDIISQDLELASQYKPFIINKCLASYPDCVLLVNEMNMNCHLDPDMQYDFYLNTVRKKKRFTPWVNKEKIEHLDNVKKYYKYSTSKALKALEILTEDELQIINKKLDTGGFK
jgi:hypothetical protein